MAATDEEPHFVEEQHFALWTKVIALLSVPIFAIPATAMWLEGLVPVAAAFTLLTVAFVLLAWLNLTIKLVTSLDSTHFRLRVHPLNVPVPFLPPRARDLALDDISEWEERTYRPLRDKEYWGNHFWGLGSASGGGAHIYMMNARPFSGRGVQVRLRDGERLLIGSTRPGALTAAITAAKGGS